MKCTEEQRHNLLVSIGEALDVGNMDLAEEIGKELKSYEEPPVRRVYKLENYPVREHESNLSKQTKTLYRATKGNHSTYFTLDEWMQVRPYIKKIHAKRTMIDEFDVVTPIAEVYAEHCNKVVFVYRNGVPIQTGTYTDIAFDYNIHFEDLNNVIEDKYLIDKEFTFSYNVGEDDEL